MRPLEGVTVIELGRVLACPFACMILAELGARVIKIEHPVGGDETRGYEPFVGSADGDRERSAYFFACNRSKESITVNFRSEAGQAIIRDLAGKADVLVENFPTGTLGRYGLDWASLRQLNDRLIYISCTGFGQDGPLHTRKGYDTVFQAMGGLMSLTGEMGGEPVKAGLPLADLTSGLWIVIAVLSSVVGRERSRTGAFVDMGMLDGQVSLLTLAAARYFALGEVPSRMGTEHPGRVPSATFACADGGFVHITGADQHWMPLCSALGLEAWGGSPRFAGNSDRVRCREEIMETLTKTIGAMARDELMARLDTYSVPCGPVRAVDEVLNDAHTRARRSVRKFDHPHAGLFDGLALPFKFDGFDDPSFDRPPLLGEHTDSVLKGLLNYDQGRIARLRQEKVV
jgi:crotonobetainyl-CoA:carnitine CoA-transferase CaiB-like acyl-CoA transferase